MGQDEIQKTRQGRAVLGGYLPAVRESLAGLRQRRVVERLWARDHTVWKPDPAEITDRLGWLRSPEAMKPALPGIASFAETVRAAGYSHALLLGMGGSSLAPEMFRLIFGARSGYPDLAVLDTTDPGAILKKAERLDPGRTLHLVSTKSGGTVETLSLAKYFYTRAAAAEPAAGRHFVAITDPGSGLASLAGELGFRKIFLNDPEIGGRYSALSFFGLVPAGLIGMELDTLLARAADMAAACAPGAGAENPGAWLGAVLGTLAEAGRDKLTLVSSPGIAPFGPWVEQLIAESTGKEGKGILPVEGEELAAPGAYGDDRVFVDLRLAGDRSRDGQLDLLAAAGHPVMRLELADAYDLGGEIFRWEMATAVAGSLLGINPFDQPDVESAKARARQMVEAFRQSGQLPEQHPALKDGDVTVFGEVRGGSAAEALASFLKGGRRGGYVVLQAYLEPAPETDRALAELRHRLRDQSRLATTVGYGPRFLHSTGQLHKGDAGQGLFVQLTADSPRDAPIPDEAGSASSRLGFGVLKLAQALGDGEALRSAGRRVLRLHLGGPVPAVLQQLTADLGG